MAWIVAPGRRVAQRDAGTSGKRRHASGASSRATEGRVLFVAGRVAGRLKWGHTLHRVRDRGATNVWPADSDAGQARSYPAAKIIPVK